MSDLARLEEHGEVLIPDPVSGEIIDVMENPEKIPELVLNLRAAKDRVQTFIGVLTTYTELLSEARGTKTHQLGGHKLILAGGTEIIWDVEELRKLRAAGLPEDRFNELVREEISYKVNASVAKQIAGANEEYEKIIERAKQTVPKRPSLKVTRSA